MALERVLRRGVSGWVHAVAGLAISVAFGWLAIRDVSWHAVRTSLAELRPGWLVAALLLLAVAVWMRAERWRALFARGRRPPRRAVFWSLNIGYLFNNLLPARAGEAARVVALRREAGVPAARGAASVAVERVFDLAALAIVMLVAAPFLGSSRVARATGWTSAALVVLAGLLLVAAGRSRLRRRLAAAAGRIPFVRGSLARAAAAELGEGARALRDSGMAARVAAWSVASWLVLAVSYYTVLRSLGIPSPAQAAVLALVVTNLVQVIPASAASLGVFEAAGRAAVAAYGAAPAAAVSAAVVLHAVNTIPLVALGAFGLARAARLRVRRAGPATVRPSPGPGPQTVTVVIPCLDEEATIAACVRSAWAGIRAAGTDGEVLVVDNGSTDRSAQLARAEGATVVDEARRGYGSAYLAGMRRARGDWILMGDGDGTYDFGELPRFLAAGAGADMVIGSRLRGRIMPGAMPWHHRYIGNPILTGMLNLLFGAGVSDAHCGLRMVRRDAADRIGLRTTGMEFASEMIIQAAQAHLAIAETPISYAARPEGSRSKLRSVPDGLRHVRFMLACTSAALIWVPAAALVALGAALILGSPTDLAVVAGGGLVWVGGMLAQAALMVRAYRLLLFDRPRRSLLGAWRRPRVALAVAVLVAVTITVAGEARLDLHRHPVTSTQTHHHRL
ncbi:MAG TPA: flippase-like domain-containing protein [Gaiellales bacterium]|nr:flippase-like domain-containing protein [Gaiellales bacterium]